MSIEELIALAKEVGFTAACELNVSTIKLREDVRGMCAEGNCGAYDKNWTCPPACGTLDECRERVAKYNRGIIVQTTGELEDAMDYEAMQETGETHAENFKEMTRRVREAMEEPSYLLEGGCTPREIMAVLGEAKLCLAMRLHTLIFAAKVATPTVGLVYDPKVESYLRELDLPSSGDVECYDSTKAIAACDELMGEYDRVLENVREKSRRLYENSEKNDTILIDLMKKAK